MNYIYWEKSAAFTAASSEEEFVKESLAFFCSNDSYSLYQIFLAFLPLISYTGSAECNIFCTGPD